MAQPLSSMAEDASAQSSSVPGASSQSALQAQGTSGSGVGAS